MNFGLNFTGAGQQLKSINPQHQMAFRAGWIDHIKMIFVTHTLNFKSRQMTKGAMAPQFADLSKTNPECNIHLLTVFTRKWDI